MLQDPHILVVDDDEDIRTLLGRYLAGQGFRVSLAGDRRELLKKLETGNYQLIVLDVLLPDGSGLDICRDLRGKSAIPIILLTALKEDVDRIIGLEIGADDYLGKPFNPRELVARIRAILRRAPGQAAPSPALTYRFEGFTLEPALRKICNPDGKEVPLTGAEFDLLQTLLDRPGRVLSREQLIDLTKGRDGDQFDRSIDVLMSRVRRKLGDERLLRLIKTVRNGGYQFVAPVTVVTS